jgi:hypothetical protein
MWRSTYELEPWWGSAKQVRRAPHRAHGAGCGVASSTIWSLPIRERRQGPCDGPATLTCAAYPGWKKCCSTCTRTAPEVPRSFREWYTPGEHRAHALAALSVRPYAGPRPTPAPSGLAGADTNFQFVDHEAARVVAVQGSRVNPAG